MRKRVPGTPILERTMVWLDPFDVLMCGQLAALRRTKRAVIIREAIRDYCAREITAAAAEAERQVFELVQRNAPAPDACGRAGGDPDPSSA